MGWVWRKNGPRGGQNSNELFSSEWSRWSGACDADCVWWPGSASSCTRIDLVTANETLWFEARLTSAADTMTGHNGEGVIPLHS